MKTSPQAISPNPGPPEACLCYTVNEAYLLPALTSATMLRRQVPRTSADVVIVCFGPPTDLTNAAADACAAEGLHFLSVPSASLQKMPIFCGMFILDEILDAAYTDITYIDADTQIVGSLEPLLTCAVPPGELVAVPDLMALMSDDAGATWQKQRAYFRSIGISDDYHSSYINSGVIRFRRTDWREISRNCLAVYQSPIGQGFKFPDQDALNIVMAGRVALASVKWNFPGFFLGCGLESIIAPRVVHYMSRPRPWDGPFHPWGKEGTDAYIAFTASHPSFAKLHRPMTGVRRLRYIAQQGYKRLAYNWGSREMRTRIARHESHAIV